MNSRRHAIILVLSAVEKVKHVISSAFCTNISRIYLTFLQCRFGKNLVIDGLPYIRPYRYSSIEIGDNVTLYSRRGVNLAGILHPVTLQTFSEGMIEIGEGSGLSGAILSSRAKITIGKRVNVGVNARIYDHDFHSMNPVHRLDERLDKANVKSAPIHIGDDVLIGANAIILKGVTIGARCVVGAGAVVVRGEYPEGSIIAGNPGRVVRRVAVEG